MDGQYVIKIRMKIHLFQFYVHADLGDYATMYKLTYCLLILKNLVVRQMTVNFGDPFVGC